MPFVIDTTGGPTGDTLGDLLEEFRARGYQYLDDTRATRLINFAYLELASAYPWPFLEVQGIVGDSSPLPDLGSVLSVQAADGSPVGYADRQSLVAASLDVSLTGDAVYWYLLANEFHSWPVVTSGLTIRYLMRPPKLQETTDRAYIPVQFTDVLVDGAVLKALKDDDDWAEHFPLLRQEYDRRVMDMIQFFDRGDRPDQIDLGWAAFSRIGG